MQSKKNIEETARFGVFKSQGIRNTETRNSISQAFYINGCLSKSLYRRVDLFEIRSKSLKNIFKGEGLYFYSRINFCTTVFSCFSTVSEQQFLELLPAVDSASVVFGSSEVIQRISSELQSQRPSLEFAYIMFSQLNKTSKESYWLEVLVVKLLGDY